MSAPAVHSKIVPWVMMPSLPTFYTGICSKKNDTSRLFHFGKKLLGSPRQQTVKEILILRMVLPFISIFTTIRPIPYYDKNMWILFSCFMTKWKSVMGEVVTCSGVRRLTCIL